jgi:hypothetical protein
MHPCAMTPESAIPNIVFSFEKRKILQNHNASRRFQAQFRQRNLMGELPENITRVGDLENTAGSKVQRHNASLRHDA